MSTHHIYLFFRNDYFYIKNNDTNMFTLEEYVTPSRTDKNGKLKLVSAIDMMQDCSQMWMKSEPALEKYFEENNISQLLVSRQSDILRLPDYAEKLIITTRVYECLSVYGYRNTVIYDEKGQPCITSWSTGAFVYLKTNKLTKLPKEISENLVIDPKIEMEYLERKIIVPDGNITELQPVKVMSNDIDMNKHMNNAHYIRIAAEFLPQNFNVNRLRIEYKIPAKYGDDLYPQITMLDEKKVYISLTNKDKQAYATIEFSK